MHDEAKLKIFLADVAATDKLGAALTCLLVPGMVIYLEGSLGAGKTALVRAMLRSQGVGGNIKSPTYALVELYEVSRLHSALPLTIYHFDFYRFNDPQEWEEAGFRDYFNERSVCLVEWPEKAPGLLPEPDVTISMSMEGEEPVVAEGRWVNIMLGANVEQKCTTAGSSIQDLISGLAT